MRLRAWLLDEQRWLCLLVGGVLGLIVGLKAWHLYQVSPWGASDFTVYVGGARALLHGVNPWHDPAFGPGHSYPYSEPLYYPLPALFFLLPLAWLSTAAAGGVFIGLSSALLGYAVMRTNRARMPLFASAGFLAAVEAGQWTPLVLAALLLPSLNALWWLKPSYGAMAFLARPRLKGALLVGVVGLLGLVLVPSWPLDWLRALGQNHHPMALMVGAGPLLLLSALAWKRPEGRLLLGLALIPHTVFWDDALLAWYIPRTWGQSILLTVISRVVYTLWYGSGANPLHQIDPTAQHLVVVGIYIPALLILGWQERAAIAARLPRKHATVALAGSD